MTQSKWTAKDYDDRKLLNWSPPRFRYPCAASEKDVLQDILHTVKPLPVYAAMEQQAIENNTVVSPDIPIPDGYYAFLENTAEQCTSPTTKHSKDGMSSARHWVQRLGTADEVFHRLTDGYGISLMFGERFHQFIRNSNNWRGVSGMMLDLDVWYQDPDTIREKTEAEGKLHLLKDRLELNETYPKPVWSMSELLERYPILPQICRFIFPTASSLYEGRAFKARGIVLFPEHLTDQRIYRAFGDTLLGMIDCLPANVTKNPLAVGFGNTHNAQLAFHNTAPDTQWIADKLSAAKAHILSESLARKREAEAQAERKAHWEQQNPHIHLNTQVGDSTGENIRAFIEKCDAIAEMVKLGWLTQGKGNEYRWHEASSDRSCEVLGDGVLHIYSHTMTARSPAEATEPVNIHRFYLYNLTGLDLSNKKDQREVRKYLYEKGYGKNPLEYQNNRAKLQRTGIQAKPTETLTENRERRETAVDKALSTDTSTHDKLQITLIKDGVGSGKTRTAFGKASDHKKRTIAPMPHTELAKQAVELAHELGFKNPCHLKGREHNWAESGIENIPVEMRTKDLFETKGVLCTMTDQIPVFTDKRLAPRIFCETQCPHREVCPYFSQYEGLGERDLIATCSPNILFDPNQRGYLGSIVYATHEPTDTDMAMDAVLGNPTSEPTEPFDFAIMDDYTVNSLYTDVTFVESEFKALRNAWKGTPTSKFAKAVLKAIGKRKPHKILKALREAVSEVDDTLNASLTHHARRGTIHLSDRSKSHKDTHALLTEKEIRYTDGGKQFIPVDIEAYQYLKEKSIPCVNPDKLDTDEVGVSVVIPHAPVQALIAGVPLDDLTPVWRKGATPIDLINMLLAMVKHNDKNAPVSKGYRSANSDTHDAVITFSIEPQAPVGLIPQIAMLSATSDPDDVKRAFGEQNVSFTEHIGGTLQFADGVKVYHFQDARLTSGSVFEYRKDDDGKRILQEAPIGITPTATKRLDLLNAWAEPIDGLTAFISYKEFTEAPFDDLVSNFDVVTHYDKVAGLNFDGLKFLVIFGYPKVDHQVVMTHARTQYASDPEVLPKADPKLRDEHSKPISEYMQLTEQVTHTENGITLTERQYKDARLEKIRHQLATDKLEQAFGRGRHAVWTDTETIVFTTGLTSHINEQTELFSSKAFDIATSPSDLPNAMQRIQDAIDTGDVQAVMETTGVSERTARRKTQETRKQSKDERDAEVIRLHKQGLNKSEIHRETGIPRSTIIRILKDLEGVTKTDNAYKYIPIGDVRFGHPPQNIDDTCVDDDIVSKAAILRQHPEFDNIIRKFAAQSLTQSCFSDHKMHTAAEIAGRTLMSEHLIESIIKDWYERVMISPGVGKSYWMNSTDIEKCQSHIEIEKHKALQHFLDEYADKSKHPDPPG